MFHCSFLPFYYSHHFFDGNNGGERQSGSIILYWKISTHKFFSTVPFRQDLHCQNLRMILTIPCSSSYLGIASTNHPTLSQVRSSIELPLTNLLPSIAVLQEIAFSSFSIWYPSNDITENLFVNFLSPRYFFYSLCLN